MSRLGKQERAAIEAVARHFSATWEEGTGSADAYLVLPGRQIGVEIRALERRDEGTPAKPRLRFDKVATRVVERLQATFGEAASDGTIVLLTLTAPIRLASKTAAVLQDKLRSLLDRGRPPREDKDTVHGNGVRIRLLRGESGAAPRMACFVHNSGTDPLLLFEMAREWLELVRAEKRRSTRKVQGDRWLVATSTHGIACLHAYRSIHSQLRTTTRFRKILIVFGDSRLAVLTGGL